MRRTNWLGVVQRTWAGAIGLAVLVGTAPCIGRGQDLPPSADQATSKSADAPLGEGVKVTPKAEPKPAPLTPEQQAWLVEKAKLIAQIEKQRATNPQAAFPQVSTLLDRDRALFGLNHEQMVTSLDVAAVTYFMASQSDNAVQTRALIHDIKKTMYGEDDWRTLQARFVQAQYQLLGTNSSKAQLNGQADAELTAADKQYGLGQFRQALAGAQSALAKYQQVYGEDVPSTLDALTVISSSQIELGQFPQAEETLQRLAAVSRHWFSVDSPAYARAMRNWGWIKHIRGNQAEAEEMLRQSVDILDRVGDAPVNELADSMTKLGLILAKTGRTARAIEVMRRALPLAAQRFGGESFDYLDAKLSLTDLLINAGEFTEAAEHIESLEAAIAKNVTQRQRLEHSLWQKQARFHFHQGKYNEAREIYQRIENTVRQQPGAAKNSIANTQYWIARTYDAQQRREEAEQAYLSSLAEFRKANGPPTQQMREACELLLSLQARMAIGLTLDGKIEEAQQKVESGMQLVAGALGPNDPLIQQARERLDFQHILAGASPEGRQALIETDSQMVTGNGLYDRQKFAEAYDAYLKALELGEPHLPADHPKLGRIYHGLCYCAWGQERFDLAEPWARRAEPIFASRAPTSDKAQLDHAQMLRDIGDLCRRRGNYREAAEFLSRAMDIYRPIKQAPVPGVLSTLEQLVEVHGKLRDETRCGPVLVEYVDRIRNLYGPEHAKYVQALRTQANIRRGFNQFDRAQASLIQASDLAQKLKLDEGILQAIRYELALVDLAAGRLDEAETKLNLLLAEISASPVETDILSILFDLQQIARRRGRLDDARQQLEDALVRVAKIDEPRRSAAIKNVGSELMNVLTQLASQARRDLRFADAAATHQRLAELSEERDGAEHWATREARAFQADAERWSKLTGEPLARLGTAHEALRQSERLMDAKQRDQARAEADRGAELIREVCGDDSLHFFLALWTPLNTLDPEGDMSPAEPWLRKRIEIYSGHLTPKSGTVADAYLHLARVFQWQGKLAESLAAARQSTNLFEQAGEPKHFDRGRAFTMQGKMLMQLGQAPAAQQALASAQEILARHRNEQPSAWSELLLAQANLALQLRDGPAALELAQAGLDWDQQQRGAESTDAAARWYYLGQAKLLLGQPKEAVEAIRKGQAISEKLGESESFARALMDNALCAAYRQLGDTQAALQSGQRAVALLEKLHKPQEAHKARFELALAYLDRGEMAEGEKLLHAIVDGEDEKVVASDMHQRALGLLAGLGVARGDDVAALPLVEQSLSLREQWFDANAQALTDALEVQWRRVSREALDRYLVLAQRGVVSAEKAYGRVVRWKGSLYARQRRLRALRDDPQAAPLLARWGSLSGALATLSLRSPYPEERAVWRARLTTLTADKADVERQLWALAKDRPAPPPATVEQLRSLLPPSAALVDFVEIDRPSINNASKLAVARRLFAFVVRHDAPLALVDLGEVAPLGDLIDQWRLAALGDADHDPAPAVAAQLGGLLRQRIWSSLESQVGDAQTVLVAPEGSLGKFPLAALPGREPNTYLLDERAFVTIPAPGLLPELLERRAASPSARDASLLLVGDIDYGAAPGLASTTRVAPGDGLRSWLPYRFSELPGFAAEAAEIKATFARRFAGGQLEMLEREAATEQSFRQAAPRGQFLHLITHGFFAPEIAQSADRAKPKYSLDAESGPAPDPDRAALPEGLTAGLALTGANRINEEGEDDGILSALEVATLDLSGVEMAVLSACETGLGESVDGESVVGLQRAFQVAGAKSTVSSLWSVSDEATRLLMARFYRNLWRDGAPVSRLEALTEAQRWMLRAARAGNVTAKDLTPDSETLPSAFQLPRFWAPFILCGDWR